MFKLNQLALISFPFVFLTASAANIPKNDLQLKTCTNGWCSSEACNRASDHILNHIDQTVDPCDNFYRFACGNYLKTKTLGDDEIQKSPFTELNDLVQNQLLSILEEPIDPEEPQAFKLAKKFYNVCTNLSAIEENDIETLEKLIESFGGLPLLEGDSWKEDEFDWKKLMFKFREHGLPSDTFLGMTVNLNVENTTQHIVIIDQAELPINRLNLFESFNNSIVKSYYNYLVDVTEYMGANREVASRDLTDSFEFLFKIGKITLRPEDRRDLTKLTNIMSIAELQERFPFMDWIEYINNIIAVPGIRISANDTVDVGVPKFVENLKDLLEATPKRTLANYAICTAIVSVAYTQKQQFTDREQKLVQEIVGTGSKMPRSKECLALTTQKLKVATGALYARKHFKESSKTNVQTLVRNLHQTLLKMLTEVDWMDEETRQEAIQKADHITSHIAYPPELLDNNKIDEYYKNLKSSDDYLQFILNIQKFESHLLFKTIREVVNKSEWTQYSSTHDINAFYNLVENSISKIFQRNIFFFNLSLSVLPAGILQEPMFNVDRPNYLNYGSIGFIVGHELTHGFDDMGKQITKDGQLRNWWTANTTKEYENKSQCIIKKYSSYGYPALRLHLNGVITQGENIADNGGAKLVYKTYQTVVKYAGKEQCLPKLNYTQNQLFWISLANTWCTVERLQQLRTEMLSKSHPPSIFRILGVITNSQYFAEDFQCPVGSNMNPKDKCTFW
ncbi:hypothetical protein FQA39_LY11802 [Lamprigera yunnana]|nr:hypothetical protein FQA39_LY11802 [Lamprigera yunnana]